MSEASEPTAAAKSRKAQRNDPADGRTVVEPPAATAAVTDDEPQQVDRDFQALIERSSLGTDGARRLRERTFQFLAAVDIEGSSRLDAEQQVRRQRDLARVLNLAARRAGMDRSAWLREVHGDGELAVLPTGTDGALLVERYPRELAAALAKLNSEGASRPRLRLRLALHHGTLIAGYPGITGPAPIEVSRLLYSDVLRNELARRTDQDLALIVSEQVYDGVVQIRFPGLDPAEFAPVIIRAKGRQYRAYVPRPVREGPVCAENSASNPSATSPSRNRLRLP